MTKSYYIHQYDGFRLAPVGATESGRRFDCAVETHHFNRYPTNVPEKKLKKEAKRIDIGYQI